MGDHAIGIGHGWEAGLEILPNLVRADQRSKMIVDCDCCGWKMTNYKRYYIKKDGVIVM